MANFTTVLSYVALLLLLLLRNLRVFKKEQLSGFFLRRVTATLQSCMYRSVSFLTYFLYLQILTSMIYSSSIRWSMTSYQSVSQVTSHFTKVALDLGAVILINSPLCPPLSQFQANFLIALIIHSQNLSSIELISFGITFHWS